MPMEPASPVRLHQADFGLSIDGFVITETVREAGVVLQPHYHDFTNVSLVLAGSFIETIGSRARRVDPASLIVRAAGEQHANQYDREARSIIIEVTGAKETLLRDGL